MIRIVASRLLGMLVVLLLVCLTIFTMLRLVPGDAAELLVPEDATPEDVARLREQWGLGQPIFVQFLHFVVNAVRLDFGVSYRFRDDVTHLIGQRIGATLELAAVALLIAIVVGLVFGIWAALRKGTLVDGILSVLSIAGVSAPHFWIGIMLVLLFSANLNLLPSGGRLPYGIDIPHVTGLLIPDALLSGRPDLAWIALQYVVLPATTLAFGMIGIIARITRSSMIDAGQEEFVFTAVAKGLSVPAVVFRHLLPNALIPIVTIIGLELGGLISGSIIVEVVFSWPGIGTLLFQAVSVRDIPLTIGIVVVYTSLFILLNVLVDLLYMAIDPRLRTKGAL